MTTNKWTVALLAATALTGVAASPALAAPKRKPASQNDLRAIVDRQQSQIDALTAQLNAMRSNAAPVAGALATGVAGNADAIDDNASSIEFMKATIEAQQAQIDGLKKTATANAPTWKGAPEFKSTGFAFKMNGLIQYDFGYVSNPNNLVNTPNLGFNSRSRRLLLGIEGEVPGDFKYKAQFNFAQGIVDYEDVLLAWEPKGKIYSAQIGYFYPFSSLENMTSNRFTSFVERAQMNEEAGNGRRIGAAVGLVNPAGDLRFNAGIFSGGINNNFNNNDWALAGRVVWSPQAWGGQLHIGGNYEYREFKTSAQGLNYQTRPFTQVTDIRFVGADIAARGDMVFGGELAGIWGPLHVAGEAQYLKVRAVRPGQALPPGQATTGTRLASDPDFFSAYGEVGYWLTGETRGYKGGKFDRTKILNPFDKGGAGGFQLVGRVDYLNLRQTVGACTVSPTVPSCSLVVNGVLNGGRQTGYLFALNWWPTDYVRFTTQYTRAEITGGPRAAAVVPLSTSPVYDRRYGVNLVQVRAAIDF